MRQLILIICITFLTFTVSNYSQSKNEENSLKILDNNNDGFLNPYEALDMLLTLENKLGQKISLKEIEEIASNQLKEKNEENAEFFNEFDQNTDGVILLTEVNEEAIRFIQLMDTNKDKSISKKEFNEFKIEDAFFQSEAEINYQISEIFNEYSTNDVIQFSEINKDNFNEDDRIFEWDFNKDGKATRAEAYSYVKAINSPVEFDVVDNVAYMNGSITSKLPATVLQLAFEHPNVKTIIMKHVPGSIDDVSNLRASLYVNKFGFTTKLTSGSVVASGGTDFFLAGTKRIVQKGAKLGVHSWGGEGNEKATDVPRDDEVHKKYLDYYKIVGIPAAFYWFTLEAAPANDIHFMTEDEIKKYNIRTEN